MNEGNKQKPIWLLIVFLVIAGIIYAGYTLNQQRQPQIQAVQPQVSPTTTQAPQATQQTRDTITLTADGFSPTTLTIKSGTTVSWINKSGKTATVNSDPHPAHTSYPPLNLGSFSDNETLSFKFDKTGTYGYHNHLNPANKGTITVE